MSLLVSLLLAVALAGVLVSALGVLTARDAFDRLHYLGPAGLVGGAGLLLAVIVQEGPGRAAGVTGLIVLIVIASGSLLTHSIARAGLVRGDARRLRDERWEISE